MANINELKAKAYDISVRMGNLNAQYQELGKELAEVSKQIREEEAKNKEKK